MVKEEFSKVYFYYNDTVPYMNQVVKVKEEHGFFLPSITHVDNSNKNTNCQQKSKIHL